jgi:uncharacterized protein YecT (DUF1311 family)
MRILAATIGFSILSEGASAADCADQTQHGLDMCAKAEFDRADRALNDAYREIMRRLGDDSHAKTLLVAAQKAWIGFRDAECAFAVSSTEGGTIYPMEFTLCEQDLTEKRTAALKTYLHCEEGDLSCPVHGP